MRFRMIFLILVLTGCSIGEQAPKPKVISINAAETKCLNGASEIFKKFFEGKVSADELRGLWDCTSKSLKLFTERTRGAKENIWTPQELRAFLETYFVSDVKTSDQMLEKWMELKQLFLGSSKEEITIQDIERALKLVEVFNELTQALRIYMPLTPTHIAGKKISETSVSELHLAQEALRFSVKKLGRSLDEAGQSYSFKQSEVFLSELKKTLVDNQKLTNPNDSLVLKLSSKVKLIQELKSLLISNGHEFFSKSGQWSKTLSAFAEWYSLYLDFLHLYQYYPTVMRGEGFERFQTILIRSFEQIKSSPVQNYKTEEFYQEVDHLIDQIDPQDLVVTQKTAKQFVRAVIGKMLAKQNTSDTAHIRALFEFKKILELWIKNQTYLIRLHDLRLDKGILRSELMTLKESLTQSDSFGSLLKILVDTPPLFNQTDEITLVSQQLNLPQSFYHQSRIHWIQVLVRRLIEVYQKEFSYELNKSELDELFLDIRDLLVETKILDVKEEHVVVSKRIRESNLFMPSGNGDQLISEVEGVQLISFILSGRRLAHKIHHLVVEKGCPTGSKDEFDFVTIDQSCYVREFFLGLDKIWKNLPQLLGFYQSLNTQDQEMFQALYNFTARKLPITDLSPAGGNTADGFSALAQFLESVIVWFDKDGSQFIESYEVSAPRVRFSPTLQTMSGLQDSKQIETLFSFLLHLGREPTKTEFLWWSQMRACWDPTLKADRLTLLRIFASLASTPEMPIPSSAKVDEWKLFENRSAHCR